MRDVDHNDASPDCEVDARSGATEDDAFGATVDADSTGVADSPGVRVDPLRSPGVGGPADAVPVDGLPAKFEVRRELGRGAMGVVYEVRHRVLDRPLAVKLMTRRGMTHEAFERFRREAQAAADLDHPNILRVHDLDLTTDGTPYLVMELLEGESFERFLRDAGPLSLRATLALFGGVVEALDRAHMAGVVHRDLKPSNLFLTSRRTLKIVDFGVCHAADDVGALTTPGQMVGTPLYMAPEQLRGETPTARTDVHALALVLFETLTGTQPFAGRNLVQLVNRRADDPLPRADERRADLPRAVGDALARGMAFAPADRPPSATALLASVRAAAGDDLLASGTGTSSSGAALDVLGAPSAPLAATVVDPPPGDTLPLRGAPRQRLRLALSVAAGLAVVAVAAVLLLPRGAGAPGEAPANAPAPADVGGPAADAVAGPVAWPGRPRLLVVPFAYAPERPLDRDLWPLVDRFVQGALESDDRLAGRLARIDPAAVEHEIEIRQLRPPFDDDAALELGHALGADTLLVGRIRRSGGLLHLDGELRSLDGSQRAVVSAADAHLLDAVRQLRDAIRDELWSGAPLDVTPERLAPLLLARPEAAQALLAVDGLASESEERRALEAAHAADPDAVGPAFALWVRDVHRSEWRAALAARADRVGDPELAAFLRDLAPDRTERPACANAVELGRRYPLAIGPLAEAVCAFLDHDWPTALRAAREAHEALPLRRQARGLVLRLLFLVKTCEEQIPEFRELQELDPARPDGWSELANWYARCDRWEDARGSLQVARALLSEEDLGTASRIGYHGAILHLARLDVEGAHPWLDLLERANDPVAPHITYFYATSLALYLQGRFAEGLAVVRAGVPVIADSDPDLLPTLVVSAFYMQLHLGDRAGARATRQAFVDARPEPRSPDDGYLIAMLDVALAVAEGSRTAEDVAGDVDGLGEAVEVALGPAGRGERQAQECLLWAHVGERARAEAVLVGADAANRLLGGCRVLRARRLLEEGQTAEAATLARAAVDDILFGRFLYAQMVPDGLLVEARALAALGRNDEARAGYERLVTNYRRADRRIPAVEAATTALAPASTSAPGRDPTW